MFRWKRKPEVDDGASDNLVSSNAGTKSDTEDALTMSRLSASRYVSESHDGNFARATIWTVVLGFFLFLAWAAVTPVYEIVSGEGTIHPEGLAKRVEHLEGGIVARIEVQEGDLVERGDVIMMLDDRDLHAELAKLRARSGVLRGSVGRFQKLLAHDPGEDFALGPDALGPGAAALLSDPAFAEDARYRLAQIRVLRARRNVTSERLGSIRARREKAQEELAISRGQSERYARTDRNGAIPLRQIENLQRETIRLEIEVSQLDGEVAVQAAAFEQSRAEESELVASYRRDAALRLGELRAELVATRQTIAQIEGRLTRTALRAPSAGVVKSLEIQNVGQVLAPGAVAAEIVPQGTRIFAEIEVSAERIGGVSTGQEASLKILTHDFTRFGDIPAEVESISPSSFQTQDGRSVFRVRLSFEGNTLAARGEPSVAARRISPGMTVVADIKSDRKTILAYLLKPVRVLADRAFTEA